MTDFGLSVAKQETEVATGASLGSPQWTAPELLRGKTPDECADIYSYGLLVYEVTPAAITLTQARAALSNIPSPDTSGHHPLGAVRGPRCGPDRGGIDMCDAASSRARRRHAAVRRALASGGGSVDGVVLERGEGRSPDL